LPAVNQRLPARLARWFTFSVYRRQTSPTRFPTALRAEALAVLRCSLTSCMSRYASPSARQRPCTPTNRPQGAASRPFGQQGHLARVSLYDDGWTFRERKRWGSSDRKNGGNACCTNPTLPAGTDCSRRADSHLPIPVRDPLTPHPPEPLFAKVLGTNWSTENHLMHTRFAQVLNMRNLKLYRKGRCCQAPLGRIGERLLVPAAL
jgi:hypothetical protein